MRIEKRKMSCKKSNLLKIIQMLVSLQGINIWLLIEEKTFIKIHSKASFGNTFN